MVNDTNKKNNKKIIFKKEFRQNVKTATVSAVNSTASIAAPTVITSVVNSVVTIADFICAETGLSKSTVKKVMLSGAVWVRNAKKHLANSRSLTRVRRATKELHHNDYVEMYYDEKILKSTMTTPPFPIFECEHYGVWYKPAGVLSQGTKFGDHISILRWVEIEIEKKIIAKKETKNKSVFLIHRLDLEVSGIMIFAYTKRAAALLSELFKNHQIEKHYIAIVNGHVSLSEITLNNKLDNLDAETHCKCLQKFEFENAKFTMLAVRITTGRYHQIRRHLKYARHSVVGDSLYRSNSSDSIADYKIVNLNKILGSAETEGNQQEQPKNKRLFLKAVGINFKCPLTKEIKNFYYDKETWSIKLSL
ncbi:MAG: RluA family pseudouridine synthase [Oligoflexia bacterium]|nr:RluA family pseudouridine synthase [Oligoflexia bacterium]